MRVRFVQSALPQNVDLVPVAIAGLAYATNVALGGRFACYPRPTFHNNRSLPGCAPDVIGSAIRFA